MHTAQSIPWPREHLLMHMGSATSDLSCYMVITYKMWGERAWTHHLGQFALSTHTLCSMIIILKTQRILCTLLGIMFSIQVWSNQQAKTSLSSVAQPCPTLCDPMKRSKPGLPVHHQLPEFTQILIHRVGDAIQPSHPLLSPSPPAPNPSQHQGLFQRVNSSHEVAKVLEFQLQHQSFQWTPIEKSSLG